MKERVSAIMTSGSLRIEFNSDVKINMNLIKSSKVNSFGFVRIIYENPIHIV